MDGPYPAAVAAVLERGDQVVRIAAQARSVGGCERPVRLRGTATVADRVTGELERVWSTDTLPDGVQHVACKNRRASCCEPCSRIYQDDAFHLIAVGGAGAIPS